MRVLFRLVSVLILAAVVAGCGFQLRGTLTSNLPYKTLYIALPETSDVRIWMQRYIKATDQTKIVNSARDAEAVFEQLQDTRVKTILSVNAQGRVREYRLQLDYRFRVVNAKGQELVGPNETNLSRDITYDDSTVLAKALAAGLLWRDMYNDLVNQFIRRLSLITPTNPDLAADD